MVGVKEDAKMPTRHMSLSYPASDSQAAWHEAFKKQKP